MNISRAGTPTMDKTPGKDKRVDDKMEILLEQQMVLEEAISYYKEKILLDDFWVDWYENSLTSYQKKLDRLMIEIANTSGYKNEPAKGIEAKAEAVAGRAGAPSPKEEKPKSKDSKAS